MRGQLLALDPGTRRTGWALFDGGDPVSWGCIDAPPRGEIEERIPAIILELDQLAQSADPPVAHVAAEKPRGIEGKRPAPELQTLIRRMRRWARSRKLGWTTYSQSTVAASVRPRGMGKEDAKTVINTGVEAIYPQTRGAWDDQQDAADAVAVGHCHLSRERETALLEAAGKPDRDGTPETRAGR